MLKNNSSDRADMSENAGDTRSIGRVFTNAIVFLSFAAIFTSMMMTVGDILVRQAAGAIAWLYGARPSWGLVGLVDLTQLAVMTAVPLAIAAAFFLNAHIRIDLFLNIASATVRRLSAGVSAALGAVLMGICLWGAWQEMRGQLDFTTTSATLGLPYTWYWAPLIIGLALSVLACLYALARAFAKP
ncbi:TRAP transporter small permease [Labrenzia sp. CE80]|uniref:TRAP transporter small permease n=1 Tax=Labrenzia sp. CE80 TaxID=1788986 RepID=UPI00129ACDC4|nr:TRAP transporter small permease [Labrenzia sp. CE80]